MQSIIIKPQVTPPLFCHRSEWSNDHYSKCISVICYISIIKHTSSRLTQWSNCTLQSTKTSASKTNTLDHSLFKIKILLVLVGVQVQWTKVAKSLYMLLAIFVVHRAVLCDFWREILATNLANDFCCLLQFYFYAFENNKDYCTSDNKIYWLPSKSQ